MEGNLGRTYSIPGTPIFTGEEAIKGYGLNRLCYSLNDAANRAEFAADIDGYCRRYGLTDDQIAAVHARDVLALVHSGGNIYYLAKMAGVFGLGVQDVGAQQTGKSLEDFHSMLIEQSL